MPDAGRILLVDNDPHWRTVVENALANLSLELEYARSKADALEVLSNDEVRGSVRLILMDHELDGELGHEVVEAILARYGKIPFAVISSTARAFDFEEFYSELGAVAFIDKSLHVDLRAKLAEILGELHCLQVSDAVLITHGTDTMSWALPYLQYSLKGLRSGVALTGSMEPMSDRPYGASDGGPNIKAAVMALSRFNQPVVFVAFNEGEDIFGSRLLKIDKWAKRAFTGERIAQMHQDELEVLDRREAPLLPAKRIHIVRTGGTIESQYEKGKGLVPTGDHAIAYVTAQLGVLWEEIGSTKSISQRKDSSNMGPDDWDEVATIVAEITGATAEPFPTAEIALVNGNPFATSDELISSLYGSPGRGAVMLGYGGGNYNVEACSSSAYRQGRTSEMGECTNDECRQNGWFQGHPCTGHRVIDGSVQVCPGLSWGQSRETGTNRPRSVNPALELCRTSGKFVVVTSQVIGNTYGFDYETGWNLLRKGALPGGDLPYPHAQVKLAYLLSDRNFEALEDVAQSEEIPLYVLFASSFLAGVGFRSSRAKEGYLSAVNTWLTETGEIAPDSNLRVVCPETDLFVGRVFEEALFEVVRAVNPEVV